MDMEKMMILFAAHSPAPEQFKIRCEHAYTENMSMATLIKAPDNVMPAFNHSHNSYEFIIPHTPIPFLIREDAIYFGEVGWVYPVPPVSGHGMKYNTPDVSHTDIVFEREYFDSFMRERGKEDIALNRIFRISDELKMYINVFKREFKRGAETNHHKLRHLAALICDEIIDLAIADEDVDGRKSPAVGYQKGIRSVAEYMNDNYMKELTVEYLAKMTGLSTNYFSTAFKKTLGDSPQMYLNKLRISRAKQLMEVTEAPFSYIAEKCGFKNQGSFTELFKRMTGQTPTEYRASMREE